MNDAKMTSILGEAAFQHVCILTRDIEKARINFAKLLGIPVPDVFVNDDYEHMNLWYKGVQASKTGTIQTNISMSEGTIELIMPNDGPSVWNDFLEEHGEGLHHLCYLIKDMDTVVDRCEEAGMKKIQTGEFPGGCYAYIDATDFIGTFLELLMLY